MAANKDYSWLFMDQSNRYYVLGFEDVPLQNWRNSFNPDTGKYEWVDNFGNAVPGIEEFAKEQRKHLKNYAKYPSDQKGTFCRDRSDYMIRKENPGDPADGLLQANFAIPKTGDLGDVRYFNGSRKINLITAERFIQDNIGNTSWPSFSARARIVMPEFIRENFVGRVNNEELDDMRTLRIFGISENATGAVRLRIGTIESVTEIVEDEKWQVVLERDQSFRVRAGKEIDWSLFNNFQTKDAVKIYDQHIILDLDYDPGPSLVAGEEYKIIYEFIVTENGQWVHDKFEDGSFTVNNGSEPYYSNFIEGNFDDSNPLLDQLQGKIILKANQYTIRATIGGSNISQISDLFNEIVTSTNVGLPNKLQVETYQNYWYFISNYDYEENTQFIEAKYDGKKWNISREFNWYDQIWIDLLKKDLSVPAGTDRRWSQILVDGKINIHDTVRVFSEGGFNESNKIAERYIRKTNGQKINVTGSRRNGFSTCEWATDTGAAHMFWTGDDGKYYSDRNISNSFIEGADYRIGSDYIFLETTEDLDGSISIGSMGQDGRTYTAADAVSFYKFVPGTSYRAAFANADPQNPDTSPKLDLSWPIKIDDKVAYGDFTFDKQLDQFITLYGKGTNPTWAGVGDFKQLPIDTQNPIDNFTIDQSTFPNIVFSWDLIEKKTTNSGGNTQLYIRLIKGVDIGNVRRDYYVTLFVEDMVSGPNSVTWTAPEGDNFSSTSIFVQAYDWSKEDYEPYPRFSGGPYLEGPFGTRNRLYIDYINPIESSAVNYNNFAIRNANRADMVGCDYGTIDESCVAKPNLYCPYITDLKFKPVIEQFDENGNIIEFKNTFISVDGRDTDHHRTAFAMTNEDSSIRFALNIGEITEAKAGQNITVSNGIAFWNMKESFTETLVDSVYLRNDQDQSFAAVVFMVPRTQLIIPDFDEDDGSIFWETIETRTRVRGWGSGDDFGDEFGPYPEWQCSQFVEHQLSLDENAKTFTISNNTNYSNYNWTFEMITPTIDFSTYEQDRLIKVTAKMEQNLEVFAVDANDNRIYFDYLGKGIYQGKVDTIPTQDKFRVILRDMVMSVQLASREYISLGNEDNIINIPGDQPPPPSPPTVENGGGVTV